ncbi:MAG: alpha-amylase family glycosyl hydrolase, partial [Muribaculaceae bacterium]|nr:alpha-amylase family glycosyl hydrolase [Muribaculaceae bacterium]
MVIILVFVCSVQPARATAFPSRTNFMDESIYFLITTRFFDGDNSNNVQCWDGKQYNTGDPAWRGDFKGLIEKLDYIKALGFTAVWITPVVENASGYDYHGYHAMNFKKVDCRYLSENVGFQELIDAVHAHDMKLILDVVFNHTGNFGEETLCPMFTKDESADLGDIDA